MDFIGINYQESEAIIGVFLAQTGFTHPVLMDQTGQVYTNYRLDGNISPFPLDYIIDRDGIVAYGAVEYNPVGMQVTLDLLLAECDTIAALTAYPLGGNVRLQWSGVPTGEYLVYVSATGGAFPASWTLLSAMSSTGYGTVTFTDTTALLPKRFYTVVHSCE